MKPKHQRLILAAVALAGIGGAGVLAASALRDEAAYFRTPVEIQDGRMRADGIFVADRILAKHDERYMPPQMGEMPKDMKAPAGV